MPPEPATVPPLFVSVRDAAAMLGLGQTLTWGLIRRGELPSRRFGKAVRVPVAALERLAAVERA